MPARLAGTLIALLVVLAPLLAQTEPRPKPPEISKPKPVDKTAVPKTDLADWTPRPATGKAEPWEKAKDPDWDDARFRQMNTGPFQNASFRYPTGKKLETVYKGTAIRLTGKGDAGVVFDRNNLRMAAVWTGGYLFHSNRRFGLLNTPTPVGTLHLNQPMGAGWADPSGSFDTKGAGTTAPLPREWAKYRGLHVHGDRVVVEYLVGDRRVFETAVSVPNVVGDVGVIRTVQVSPGKKAIVWRPDGPEHEAVKFEPKDVPLTSARFYNRPVVSQDSITGLLGPGPKRWGKPIVTKLARGEAKGPFAIDTLTIPYENEFKALFFCTGLDFLPDGRVAVCTCHGDVWLVTVDEAKGECQWQRYATGLYHPLGLKVVGGKVVVLERGQLTRLHDENADGEADFYENVNSDWDTGGGEHSYDTCLETDPDGNFYFFKTGDTNTPTGGCLIKVAKDGSKSEVFCTGFRHPIGMGLSPTGIVTGADQEGNWMPSTRIDEYKKGGFYGDMRAHHRTTPPSTYDRPLCWLPREVDNSAGGQVWVPAAHEASKASGGWAALAGLPLHLSYGRCKAFVLLRQETPQGTQGAVWDLGLTFLSGVCRGRFHADGNLYVCGLNGWQTAAQADGCLQRVRATGKPPHVPVKWEAVPDGVKLTFSEKLDRKAAETTANYRAAWWGYRWSGEYGSKRWKVSDPNAEGQDDVPVTAAKLLADSRTVHLTLAGMRPVPQLQLAANLKAADGTPIVGSIFGTVHDVGK